MTRLAPSPTGALHLGNARTFLVNWALARREGWRILMRIEDLDTPRTKPGATRQALDDLAWLGLDWDGEPMIQSADLTPSVDAMHRLAADGFLYPCELTRGQIEQAASAPQEGSHETPFPAGLRPETFPSAFNDPAVNWRFCVPDVVIEFHDAFAGHQRHMPAETVGDFVVWTRRAQPAYQLAVVVDDARAGVTDVVRGDDLLDSASRQLLLYRALKLTPEPRYMHLPLVRGEDGRRLAKRHGDTRLSHYRERGVPPERVVALLAGWCGIKRTDAMTAAEFRSLLDPARIPRGDVIFTQEDDRWVIEAASRRS